MSPIERSAGGGGGGGGLALLFDSTLSVAAQTIDTGANGVAGTSKNLYVTFLLRSDRVANNDLASVFFNNDTAANYDRAVINADSGNFSGSRSLAEAGILFGVPAASNTANYPAVWSLTIPAYAQTTFFKTSVVFGGWLGQLVGGLQWQTDQETSTWRNTAAITRIAVTCSVGNFIAGSRVTIYGTP